MLVVLNGASSAGKTTVARALEARLGPQTVLTGLDEVIERVRPFGPDGGGAFNALCRTVRIVRFGLSDGRLKLFKQLHREAAAHTSAGRDVIVETALMDLHALRDAAVSFAPLGGLFVAVKPPLEVSERWEASRGDRPRGQARRHYDLIHAHGIYDLVLDTSTLSPDACAEAILNRAAGPPPDAFRRLLNAQG